MPVSKDLHLFAVAQKYPWLEQQWATFAHVEQWRAHGVEVWLSSFWTTQETQIGAGEPLKGCQWQHCQARAVGQDIYQVYSSDKSGQWLIQWFAKFRNILILHLKPYSALNSCREKSAVLRLFQEASAGPSDSKTVLHLTKNSGGCNW